MVDWDNVVVCFDGSLSVLICFNFVDFAQGVGTEC